MSETKFTPGPWKADGLAICGAGTEYDVDGCMVALTSRAMTHNRFTRMIKRSEEEPNAVLIASVPCLYSALEAIVHLWCEHEAESVAFSDAIEEAANALAAARGEST